MQFDFVLGPSLSDSRECELRPIPEVSRRWKCPRWVDAVDKGLRVAPNGDSVC
jgi:hypothetical protein